MLGLVLFMVFQVPTPSKVAIDANWTYSTATHDVQDQFSVFYSGSRVFDADTQPYIFKYKWEADLMAKKLTKIIYLGADSYWVRTMKADEKLKTFYIRNKLPIGEML